MLAIGLGILLTICAILLETMSFSTYPKTKHLVMLFSAAVAENFGYRQINTFWRCVGLVYWFTGYEESRAMVRTASWQETATAETAEENSAELSEEAQKHAQKI